jgi:Mg2+ and Co2+ transporter CorA
MNKFIYILLSTCIVILFFLYIFKPAPPVPPVPTPVVVDTWPAKVDSFNTVIQNLNNQVDSIAKKLASAQQQKPQVESFTVDQHIAYFGELTGDTTLEMRLKDSVVLTPIACIVRANTIMADGIQAKTENKMYEQLVLVQKGIISSQAQMIQESNKKVELQKKENQELIQENIAVNKELDKTIHKNKTLRQITGGSVVLTVAVVVAAIIVL